MRRAVVLPLVAALTAAGTTALAVQGVGANPAPTRVTGVQPGVTWPLAAHPSRTRLAATARAFRAGRVGGVAPRHATTTTVTVTGDRSGVAAQARRLGGRVLVSAEGATSVELPSTRVAQFSAAPGVGTVQPGRRAVELDVTSEGVAASGADVWQNAGRDGTGVTIGIVDAGFADLAAEITAGRLPSTTAQPSTAFGCAQNGPDVGDTQHGTAVAEIVHQMAPGATLVLYCIQTSVGFNAAEQDIVAHHPEIKIVSSSLGFPGDARGDGSGDPTSAAHAVRDARRHGILWIQSAGNSAADHWSGTLTDGDGDHVVDLDGVFDPSVNHFESDTMFVPSGGQATLELQWDAWPATRTAVSLLVQPYQCDSAGRCDTALNGGNPFVVDHPAGTAPYVEYDADNTSPYGQVYVVGIGVPPGGYPTIRYDLTYEGTVSYSTLACPTLDARSNCTTVDPRAYSGSVASPANSPWAMAVGAADVGDASFPRGTLEQFSSRGPTIDGRTKPDITGWDGVSSNLPDFAGGFYGTSAAAPHVAGAAALALQAAPSLDASQLQNLLEQRANQARPVNPASSASGHGLLTLGATTVPVSAPTSARFQPVTPRRILDTRRTHRLGKGSTVTVTVPGLPADATAVAINLTGVGATAATYLAAYPGSTAWPGTSNLNLSPGADATAAVFAVVTVRNRQITVRNGNGAVDVLVDELGYFGTGSEAGRYRVVAPKRVADAVPVAANGVLDVDPHLPSGATAAVVNVTTAGTTGTGFVSAGPTCSTRTSTLNFTTFPRANLAVVGLNARRHLCVANGGRAARVYVDVVGYLAPSGAEYVALPAGQRIVDTRTGNGAATTGATQRVLVGGRAVGYDAAGIGDVPASATALLTGIVEAANDRGGYLTVYPGTPRPATSTLNYTPGRVVANAGIIGLAARSFAVYASTGSTQAAVDLFGYFGPVLP